MVHFAFAGRCSTEDLHRPRQRGPRPGHIHLRQQPFRPRPHPQPPHRGVEKLLNDRHASEDIVQETLIRAWHHLERPTAPRAPCGAGCSLWHATCRPAAQCHPPPRNHRLRQLPYEEVVQEVFLRAWRASDSFDSRRGSLRTWL
ncbi:sigma factor [Streptomyces sp. NPDC048595]|uniref:sigma factor n=1 Tax=Streptomyces sp. NPDC048595 TaxID=3365576 RepID=UPI00371C0D61